jgi:hypothetical protein
VKQKTIFDVYTIKQTAMTSLKPYVDRDAQTMRYRWFMTLCILCSLVLAYPGLKAVESPHLYNNGVIASWEMYDLAKMFSVCFILPLGFHLMYVFGGSRISDWEIANRGDYSNIGRVMSYRESVMGSQGNRRNAELMAQTQILDGIMHNKELINRSPNARSAVAYMDSMFGSMSNEDALKWLSRGGK